MVFLVGKIKIDLIEVRVSYIRRFAAPRHTFYLALYWHEHEYASYHFIVFVLVFVFTVAVRNFFGIPALVNAENRIVVKACAAGIKLLIYGINLCESDRESLVRILCLNIVRQFIPYKHQETQKCD